MRKTLEKYGFDLSKEINPEDLPKKYTGKSVYICALRYRELRKKVTRNIPPSKVEWSRIPQGIYHKDTYKFQKYGKSGTKLINQFHPLFENITPYEAQKLLIFDNLSDCEEAYSILCKSVLNDLQDLRMQEFNRHTEAIGKVADYLNASGFDDHYLKYYHKIANTETGKIIINEFAENN